MGDAQASLDAFVDAAIQAAYYAVAAGVICAGIIISAVMLVGVIKLYVGYDGDSLSDKARDYREKRDNYEAWQRGEKKGRWYG